MCHECEWWGGGGGGEVCIYNNMLPLSHWLRWLDHLVLHCTDEAQLDRNSCLQFVFQSLCPFVFHISGSARLEVHIQQYMITQKVNENGKISVLQKPLD